jgi:hypothetical protein
VRRLAQELRRIGTRFEKLPAHGHGMLQFSMIRLYLKLLFSQKEPRLWGLNWSENRVYAKARR